MLKQKGKSEDEQEQRERGEGKKEESCASGHREGERTALNLAAAEKRNAGKDGKQLNGVKTTPFGGQR